MEAKMWLAWGTLMFLGLLGLRRIGTVWRGEEELDDDVPSWWVLGRRLWLGYRRSLPSVAVVTLAAFVPLPLAVLLDGEAQKAVTWYILAMIGMIAVVSVATVLFNRPRFLVPPRHRQEPGALSIRSPDDGGAPSGG